MFFAVSTAIGVSQVKESGLKNEVYTLTSLPPSLEPPHHVAISPPAFNCVMEGACTRRALSSLMTLDTKLETTLGVAVGAVYVGEPSRGGPWCLTLNWCEGVGVSMLFANAIPKAMAIPIGPLSLMREFEDVGMRVTVFLLVVYIVIVGAFLSNMSQSNVTLHSGQRQLYTDCRE